MGDVIVRVEGLGKKYRIRHEQQERYTALRDVITNKLQNGFRPQAPRAEAQPDVEDFWALKDATFEVKRGEVLGIIGRNGAGKSTLLKILSRITEPTTGRVELEGRVASLLEVGTGFHPELTGRENIFLNGAILGMGRAEIRRKFDEIVAFAEVATFLDTPVKRYSSGMYVRLAFSVAAHLEPEILIVDEVLAVGDAEFQKKCSGKMQDVSQADGRTILVVSHDISLIRKLSNRALLLHRGKIEAAGPAETVCSLYRNTSLAANETIGVAQRAPQSITHKTMWIQKIEIQRLDGRNSGEFSYNDSFILRFYVSGSSAVSRFGLDWALIDRGRVLAFSKSNTTQTCEYTKVPAVYECTVGPLPLSEGFYQIAVGIRLLRHEAYWDWWNEALQFEIVACDPFSTGYAARFDHSGPVVIPHSWAPAPVTNV